MQIRIQHLLLSRSSHVDARSLAPLLIAGARRLPVSCHCIIVRLVGNHQCLIWCTNLRRTWDSSMCRPQDHIITERKEQKINQRFIESSHVLKVGLDPIYKITQSCNSTTTSTLFLIKTELHCSTYIDYDQFGPSVYKILGPPLILALNL